MSGRRCYDMVVVGAGPAGAAAAIEAAARGADVLLVERHGLPRPKVCGGCLGARALSCLARLGVDATVLPGAHRLDRVRVRIAGSSMTLPLDQGIAVDRTELDHALVRRAADGGATILTRARATIGEAGPDRRQVRIVTDEGAHQVEGRIVLDATGLPPDSGAIASGESRVGLGQARRGGGGPAAGEVWMLSGGQGYVGLVRFGDGTLNAAASVRADVLLASEGPGALVDAILAEAGGQPLGWSDGWRGTRKLRRVALGPPTERLLPIGDAAGFWEPFTGEGIGWALESGIAAVAPALRLAGQWSCTEAIAWARSRRRWMLGVQARSRAVGWLSAHPRSARVAMGALRAAGPLARWAVPAGQPRLPSAAVPGAMR